jgi:FkbM family methyltransferase
MIPIAIKRAAFRIIGAQNYVLLQAMYRLGQGYQEPYRKFLQELPAGGLLLDIGANIGLTVAYAKRKRPDLMVIAFEPLSFNVTAAQRLLRMLRINDVSFHQVALGDSAGTVEMVLPIVTGIIASGQSHVVHDFEYPQHVQHGGRFTVPVETLDSFHFPHVDGIKLDVENFEAYVVRGGLRLIERDRPSIYCELWDTPNRTEVMDVLGNLGYSCGATDATNDFVFRYPVMAGGFDGRR